MSAVIVNMAGQVVGNSDDEEQPVMAPSSRRNTKQIEKPKLSEQFKKNLFYDLLDPAKLKDQKQQQQQLALKTGRRRPSKANALTSERSKIRSNIVRKSSSSGALDDLEDYDTPIGTSLQVYRPPSGKQLQTKPKKMRKSSSTGKLEDQARTSKKSLVMPRGDSNARSRSNTPSTCSNSSMRSSSFPVEDPQDDQSNSKKKFKSGKSLLSKIFRGRSGGSERKLVPKSNSCGDLKDIPLNQKLPHKNRQTGAQKAPRRRSDMMNQRQGSRRSLHSEGELSRPRSTPRAPINGPSPVQGWRKKRDGNPTNPSDLRHYGRRMSAPPTSSDQQQQRQQQQQQRRPSKPSSGRDLRIRGQPPPPGRSSSCRNLNDSSALPRNVSSSGDLSRQSRRRSSTGYSMSYKKQLVGSTHIALSTATIPSRPSMPRSNTTFDDSRRNRGNSSPREKVFFGMEIAFDSDFDCSSSSGCSDILSQAPLTIEEAQRRLDEIEEDRQTALRQLREDFEQEKKMAHERFQQQLEAMREHSDLEELEKKYEDMENERHELEDERRELEAEIRDLARDLESLRDENQSLEKDNADQYDVFQILTEYAKKEKAKNLKLVSTERKLKDIYNGSMTLIAAEKLKNVYRGCMYKCARGVELSEESNDELCEDIMKMITDTEAELGCDVNCSEELGEDIDTSDVNANAGDELFAITEETASQADSFLEESYRLKVGETTNDKYDQIDEEIQDCKEVMSGISSEKDMTTLYENKEILFTIFKLLDSDGNGELDRSEFQVGISLLNRRLDNDSQFRDHDVLFEALDADKSGTIDLDEFAQIFSINDAAVAF